MNFIPFFIVFYDYFSLTYGYTCNCSPESYPIKEIVEIISKILHGESPRAMATG